MKKIYKYTLEFTDTQEVDLPIGAQILDIQKQGRVLCLWAIVNPDILEPDPVTICIVGTGHAEVTDDMEHITTLQDGNFVWHFFKKVKS